MKNMKHYIYLVAFVFAFANSKQMLIGKDVPKNAVQLVK
jgi:hypothetical protein